MKKNIKKNILKPIVFTTLCWLLMSFIFFLAPTSIKAQTDTFVPQVQIPTIKKELPISNDLLGIYIKGIYDYSFLIAGILAAVVLMGGGVLWLISGGNQSKVAQAKEIISGSLIGLIILFSAYLILNTINPDLLSMKPISVFKIDKAPSTDQQMTCCACVFSYTNLSTMEDDYQYNCETASNLSEEKCQNLCEKKAINLGREYLTEVKFEYDYKINYVCGTGKNENKCIPPPENKQYLIYNDQFDRSGWEFQTEIDKQIPHMSSELARFLNCMRANLPDGIGEISSISDSNIVDGTVSMEDCNKYNCPVMLCAHSCQSCHYGGGIIGANESYAVDLGDENNLSYFKTATNICDSGSYIKDEDDHIHISISKCPKN